MFNPSVERFGGRAEAVALSGSEFSGARAQPRPAGRCDRWQIELFFKALKQNLKVKTFVGTSANALKIQLWTALIAMLVLKYLQLTARFAWSLANLVALLRMNLFTYRDLWAWLEQPFGGPPALAEAAQQEVLALG
jgi:hypothetical protein